MNFSPGAVADGGKSIARLVRELFSGYLENGFLNRVGRQLQIPVSSATCLIGFPILCVCQSFNPCAFSSNGTG